jgi:hypothetical protein
MKDAGSQHEILWTVTLRDLRSANDAMIWLALFALALGGATLIGTLLGNLS